MLSGKQCVMCMLIQKTYFIALVIIVLVKVHVDEGEYKATEAICKDFENGVGKILHEKLMAKAAKERNWVKYYEWQYTFY